MLLAISCAKETQGPADLTAGKAVFTASSGESASKLTMDNLGAISWDAGDEVGVWGGSWTNAVFTAIETGSTSQLSTVSDGDIVASENYYALSPYVSGASFDGNGVFTLEIPATQTLGTDRLTFSPAVAVTTGAAKSFSFRNACGLVSFDLVLDDIAKVMVYGNNKEVLSGTLTIDASNPSAPLATLSGDGSYTLTLLPSSSTFAPGTYYLALPPMTFSMGITISFFKADGTLRSKHQSSAFSVVRNGWSDFESVESGTYSKEYKIKNASQLQAFLSLAEQNWASDIVGYLANDIDLTGVTLPGASEFYATLDGKNFSLKNWATTRPLVSYNNGTIKDLTIDATCSISAAGRTETAFIAKNNFGTVSGCINNASLAESITISESSYFGFLVARNYNTVSDCTNNGNLTFTINSTDGTSYVFVGGVVGQNGGPEIEGHTAAASLILSGNVNAGDISYTATAAQRPFLGGVCGGSYPSKAASIVNQCATSNCVNRGAVSFNYTGSSYFAVGNIGGVIGYNEGTLTSCTNEATGTVSFTTPTDDSSYYAYSPAIGGVSGCVTHTATSCSNAADVTVTLVGMTSVARGSTPGANGTGPDDVVAMGGVFGKVGTTVVAASNILDGCVNTGDLTFTTSVKSNGTAARCEHFFGGVAGFVKGPATGCKNEGSNMTVDSKAATSSVGGAFGYAAADLDNCDNSADIDFDFVSTAENGIQGKILYLGGILGRTDDATDHLTNCDNTGNITATHGGSYITSCYIAGVMAYSSGTTESGVSPASCSNSGTINCSVPALVKVAGIVGMRRQNISYVSSSYPYTTNTGNITVTGCQEGSLIGGISAQHVRNRTWQYTTQNADITVSPANITDVVYVSLLEASNTAGATPGNINNTTSVKGNITTNAAAKVGLFYGLIDRTTAKTATISGKVLSGTTINGTAMTSSNYKNYLAGEKGSNITINSSNASFVE